MSYLPSRRREDGEREPGNIGLKSCASQTTDIEQANGSQDCVIRATTELYERRSQDILSAIAQDRVRS